MHEGWMVVVVVVCTLAVSPSTLAEVNRSLGSEAKPRCSLLVVVVVVPFVPSLRGTRRPSPEGSQALPPPPHALKAPLLHEGAA